MLLCRLGFAICSQRLFGTCEGDCKYIPSQCAALLHGRPVNIPYLMPAAFLVWRTASSAVKRCGSVYVDPPPRGLSSCGDQAPTSAAFPGEISVLVTSLQRVSWIVTKTSYALPSFHQSHISLSDTNFSNAQYGDLLRERLRFDRDWRRRGLQRVRQAWHAPQQGLRVRDPCHSCACRIDSAAATPLTIV